MNLKNMKRYFKYRYFRFLVKLNNKKKLNTLEMDKIQKSAYEIVIELINDKNTIFFHDPFNYQEKEFFKAMENKEIAVLISRRKVTIFIDGHSNDVPFDEKTIEEITERFNERLSKRFKSLTNRLMSTVKGNLEDIKGRIEQK